MRPYRVDGTEIASALATPGGLDRVGKHVAATALQIPPRERHLRQNLVWQSMFAVNALESAAAEVLDQLRPRSLAAPDDNAVGVLDGLAGQDRHMDAAQHHRDAAPAEVRGQGISRARAARDHTDTDEVGRFVPRDGIHAAVPRS